MGEIKPINTIYNGYRFRSRLEARWAVFFDKAGIKYEYEPEGFVLSDGSCYLPDFWLPDIYLRHGGKGLWVEVKGKMTKADKKKIELFTQPAQISEIVDGVENVYLEFDHPLLVVGYIPENGEVTGIEGSEYPYWNFETIDGDSYTAAFCLTKDNRIGIAGFDNDWFYKTFDSFYSFLPAYTAARQARFEHGECGAPDG